MYKITRNGFEIEVSTLEEVQHLTDIKVLKVVPQNNVEDHPIYRPNKISVGGLKKLKKSQVRWTVDEVNLILSRIDSSSDTEIGYSKFLQARHTRSAIGLMCGKIRSVDKKYYFNKDVKGIIELYQATLQERNQSRKVPVNSL